MGALSVGGICVRTRARDVYYPLTGRLRMVVVNVCAVQRVVRSGGAQAEIVYGRVYIRCCQGGVVAGVLSFGWRRIDAAPAADRLTE